MVTHRQMATYRASDQDGARPVGAVANMGRVGKSKVLNDLLGDEVDGLSLAGEAAAFAALAHALLASGDGKGGGGQEGRNEQRCREHRAEGVKRLLS